MENKFKGYNLSTTINNFDVSYNDVGVGNLPIIFLHGFPFDKTMWQHQLDFLKPTYRAIACDIRGFGKSSDEESALSMDLFADDLIKFMDKLHLDKAVVCGLSMGGFLALNALKKFPERFEAVILADTQCIADTVEVREKRLKIIEDIKLNGVNNFNETFIKSVFHKDTLTNQTELVEQLKAVVFANSQRIIVNGLVALANRGETCSSLSAINIPSLIICGREDVVTPLKESEFMHKNIKGSTLCVIENAGHVSNLEQPNEFNKHLLNFLSTLNTNTAEHIIEKQWKGI